MMRTDSDKKRISNGFALGQLLVVIGILGIGAAMLIPAVSESRMKATATACQANLKNWGFIFTMYTNDNNGYFWEAWSNATDGHLWINSTKPYYDNPDVLFCPSAKTPRVEDASSSIPGGGLSSLGARNVNESWGRFSEETAESRRGYRGVAGSYGVNQWVSNPYVGKASTRYGKERYWAEVTTVKSDEIPLFLDCIWLGGMPEHLNNPPGTEQDTYYLGGSATGAMYRFMPNRHVGAINGVFMDGAARRISLKGLWRLKWHREFENNDPSKNPWISKDSHWPAWMQSFDDKMLLD